MNPITRVLGHGLVYLTALTALAGGPDEKTGQELLKRPELTSTYQTMAAAANIEHLNAWYQVSQAEHAAYDSIPEQTKLSKLENVEDILENTYNQKFSKQLHENTRDWFKHYSEQPEIENWGDLRYQLRQDSIPYYPILPSTLRTEWQEELPEFVDDWAKERVAFYETPMKERGEKFGDEEAYENSFGQLNQYLTTLINIFDNYDNTHELLGKEVPDYLNNTMIKAAEQIRTAPVPEDEIDNAFDYANRSEVMRTIYDYNVNWEAGIGNVLYGFQEPTNLDTIFIKDTRTQE